MLPLLAVMVAIIGWPLFDTVRLSFTDARLVGTKGDFIGAANYIKLLGSSSFRRTLITTTQFAVVSVALEIVLGVLTALLLAFLLAWDEFFYALLFTSDQNSKTVTVAIADLAGGRVSDYGLIATAGVLAALPPVVIGIFMQRALVSGLTAGGVKE